MARPGRKSQASLAVVTTRPDGTPAPVSGLKRRPQPPESMTDRQAAVWREIVDDLPADWFPRHMLDMLAAYVRHAVELERLARLIDALPDEPNLRDYFALLDRRDKEGRALSSLGTRLRLTKQATSSKDLTKPPQGKGIERPWES